MYGKKKVNSRSLLLLLSCLGGVPSFFLLSCVTPAHKRPLLSQRNPPSSSILSWKCGGGRRAAVKPKASPTVASSLPRPILSGPMIYFRLFFPSCSYFLFPPFFICPFFSRGPLFTGGGVKGAELEKWGLSCGKKVLSVLGYPRNMADPGPKEKANGECSWAEFGILESYRVGTFVPS